MTTPEPLWSDERIAANMEDEGAYLDSYIGEKVFPIFQQARDQYEAERAAHLTSIAELRRAVGDVQTLLAQLDSLEAQLAEAVSAIGAEQATEWEVISDLNHGEDCLVSDEGDVIIGRKNITMATFRWPEDGYEYAIMRRKAGGKGGPAMTPNRVTHAGAESIPLIAHAYAPTRAAIAAYIAHRDDPILEPPPTPIQVRLVAQYLQDYICSPIFPYPGDDLRRLRREVEMIRTLDDLARWLWDCRRIGIEPL